MILYELWYNIGNETDDEHDNQPLEEREER